MADVSIKYKGNVIAEMSGSGSKTLTTSGHYCEEDVQVQYAPNFKAYNLTIAKASGWVLLTTLDAEVLVHINDASFAVCLAIQDDYAYEYYSTSFAFVSNTPITKQGSYFIYGMTNRQLTETSASQGAVFYPANKTGTDVPLGGLGYFRVDGNKYYIKPSDGFLRGGNYRLTFMW